MSEETELTDYRKSVINIVLQREQCKMDTEFGTDTLCQLT